MSAGMNPSCSMFIFHESNCAKHSKSIFPLALTISVDAWLNNAHPWSLPSKLSNVRTSCIIGSISIVRPWCILEYHMLSKRTQKYHIITRSCQVPLSFSSVTMFTIFLMRSLGLLFPTYIISKGIRASNAARLIEDVNLRIHSMSSPPYKQMYLPSRIY